MTQKIIGLIAWTTFWGMSLLSAHAQEMEDKKTIFTFKAQLRLRTEGDARDFKPATDLNSYTLLRTRFAVIAQPLKNISAFLQLQDSRNLGFERSPTENMKNVDMHQAYIEFKGFFWDPLTVRAGRMEVAFDNERLIGTAGWNNVGRSFGGLQTNIQFMDKLQLSAFVFQIEEKSVPPSVVDSGTLARSYPDRDDRWFSGLYLSSDYLENNRVSAYLLADRDGTPKTVASGTRKDSLSRITTGIFLRHSYKNWSVVNETAYQFGSIADKKIRAYMLTSSLAYTCNDLSWKPVITLGADILSGDTKKNDAKETTFHTLFGSNHRYYGYMDYFSDIPKQTKKLGLRNLFLRGKVQLSTDASIEATYHHFASHKKSRLHHSNVFGNEVDFVFQYRFNKHFRWEQGASLFIPGTLMKQWMGGHSKGYWLYGMAMFDI